MTDTELRWRVLSKDSPTPQLAELLAVLIPHRNAVLGRKSRAVTRNGITWYGPALVSQTVLPKRYKCT